MCWTVGWLSPIENWVFWLQAKNQEKDKHDEKNEGGTSAFVANQDWFARLCDCVEETVRRFWEDISRAESFSWACSTDELSLWCCRRLILCGTTERSFAVRLQRGSFLWCYRRIPSLWNNKGILLCEATNESLLVMVQRHSFLWCCEGISGYTQKTLMLLKTFILINKNNW